MPLILDTGVLYAHYDRSDAWHARSLALLDGEPGPLVLPTPVLPEIDFLLGRRLGRLARLALYDDIEREVYLLHEPTKRQRRRALELDRRFDDLDLGFVDAAVIAVAEDLGGRIATADRRHFVAVAVDLGLTLLP